MAQISLPQYAKIYQVNSFRKSEVIPFVQKRDQYQDLSQVKANGMAMFSQHISLGIQKKIAERRKVKGLIANRKTNRVS